MKLRRLSAACGFVLGLAIGPAANANLSLGVSLNTAALGPGNYALAFSFQDGSALGDDNNTATLSNFSFGGGAASAADPFVSSAAFVAGKLSSSVTLRDGEFSALFVQGFTPGNTLSFNLDLSTNADAVAPDLFGFSLLLDGNPLPTLDDLQADNLLYVSIDSANPAPMAWATGQFSPVALDAPGLGPVLPLPPPPSQVPEPGSLWLSCMAGLCLLGFRRRPRAGVAVSSGA